MRYHLLLDINIELSDNTYASTCELVVVDTIEQLTIERRDTRLDLKDDKTYLYALCILIHLNYF